jgi:two-component system, OmpR family, phosphate regulon sensor histidine kinase PhoR
MTVKRRTFFGQLFPAFLLIALLSIVLVTWHATNELERFYSDRTQDELAVRADLVEARFVGPLLTNDSRQVDALCKQIASKDPMRLTVVLPSGQVVGDSEEDPARMDNHADRPEIVQSLRTGQGISVRFSDTLQREMVYVARLIRDNGKTLGVLRASVSLAFIDHELDAIHRRMTLAALLAAGLAGIFSLWISRRFSRPLARLKTGAERFAQGELATPLVVPDSLEIGALAESMNQMAADLDDRIQTTVRQRNELETVLASMIEGVLAIDTDAVVLNLNEAAARLIGVDAAESRHRPLQEVVRNVEIHEIVRRVINSGKPDEAETVFQSNQKTVIHIRATPLKGTRNENSGVLVVMTDMSRIRHLEKVRQDFVANVSHELKTPITSIKGYVETLQDGAAEEKENLDRFLKIIHRQADRLQAIIDDLLALAQIEENGTKGAIALQRYPLLPVLQTAKDLCRPAASNKNMQIHVSCLDGVEADIDVNLLEQAVLNLMDNAVKYSQPGTEVHVEAVAQERETIIRVRDQGPGIAAKHLPRLFERFYRVDKGRSRDLGGTGLGLAIVKHIAQAHRGTVTVQSQPGKGSVFTIRLPAF